MKKFIICMLLIYLSFLFTGCATTTGAIQFSGHHYKKDKESWSNNGSYAIFIDDEFIYENNNIITDLPAGNHHIIIKHPNKTLIDTTIDVSNEWSIQNKTHTFLGLTFSIGLAFIPFPSSILYFLAAPIPVFIARLNNIDGTIPLNIKTGPDPILTKIDSTIGIKINSNTRQKLSKKDISDYYPTYYGFIETNEFCLDKSVPNEPLVWFFTKEAEPMLYAIPRKHITICKSADPDNNVCGPQYEAILEEHLCPQL